MTSTFKTDFIVSKEDIDNLNHVNNAVYVRWMEDVAQKHWNIFRV